MSRGKKALLALSAAAGTVLLYRFWQKRKPRPIAVPPREHRDVVDILAYRRKHGTYDE